MKKKETKHKSVKILAKSKLSNIESITLKAIQVSNILEKDYVFVYLFFD